MANWQNLKEDIAAVIRTNGNEEITGEVLQYILLEMVSRMGADFGIMGVCTPATQPVEPDGRIVYIGGAGEYRNFEGAGVDVPEGSIVDIYAPLDASKVMVIDPKTKKPTRVYHKVVDGKKIRVAKSGEALD